jgi:hypothetical protein
MGGDGPAIPAVNGEGGGTGTRSDAPAPSKARNRDRTGDLILTKDVLYRLSYACDTCRAGDGARTRDIKLGRLALYQLSYSRDLLILTLPAPHRLPYRPMVGEGFEPSKADAGRFTVCSRWPLGYPTPRTPSPTRSHQSRRRGSNSRPPDYKSGALPAELRRRYRCPTRAPKDSRTRGRGQSDVPGPRYQVPGIRGQSTCALGPVT